MKAGPKRPVTAPALTFDDLPPRGWKRVDAFAKEYLRVPKGTGAKEPFRLRKWQLDIVKGLYPQRGQRPRQGLLSMPRGNGKTGLAAVLGAYGLFADGVEGAQVLIVASDERQAGHVFRAVRRMIELEPRLEEQVQIYADRIYVPNTDSELRTLPAEPGALQGWDPSLMIVDELHVVTEAVWEAVTSAAGKRETSLTLAISTPADSPESIMWRLVEWGREGADSSFYYQEYSAPDGCALDDEKAWKIANPALGDFLHADALRATLKTTREPAFRRYRLGQWVGQAEGWLPWGQWDSCAAPDRLVADGERVVLAFDGSASGDSTALVGCTVGPDPHVFVVDVWANPGERGWRVPRGQVDQVVAAAFDRWDVVELACDPWGWRSEIESWSKRHGEKKVLEWNTAHAGRMAPATDRLYQATATEAMTHDADARMAAHVANCKAKSTPMGDLVTKDKRGSPRKIDAAVAAIVAFDRAAWHSNKSTRKRAVSFR
ncbi:terminase large subunit domain-containing protein [Isoptericola sp. G70]|uniref:terminase large subunit domain-containing protein n=1 Tax=Isoptericola sp. G70 TaxID=3376633 RepID=UPI003A808883